MKYLDENGLAHLWGKVEELAKAEVYVGASAPSASNNYKVWIRPDTNTTSPVVTLAEVQNMDYQTDTQVQSAIETAIEGIEAGPQGPKGDKGDTGEQGPKGEDGADGFSPTISETATAAGYDITITDKTHTSTISLVNGAKGDTGEQGPKGDPGNNYTITAADYSAIAAVVYSDYMTNAENVGY